ncbi:unnamed protein product [Amoebophrya sp. A120]|nr:unnamed protein product [Amoebophrya sp. A120]|eukprot:GSA120T00008958001.1
MVSSNNYLHTPAVEVLFADIVTTDEKVPEELGPLLKVDINVEIPLCDLVEAVVGSISGGEELLDVNDEVEFCSDAELANENYNGGNNKNNIEQQQKFSAGQQLYGTAQHELELHDGQHLQENYEQQNYDDYPIAAGHQHEPVFISEENQLNATTGQQVQESRNKLSPPPALDADVDHDTPSRGAATGEVVENTVLYPRELQIPIPQDVAVIQRELFLQEQYQEEDGSNFEQGAAGRVPVHLHQPYPIAAGHQHEPVFVSEEDQHSPPPALQADVDNTPSHAATAGEVENSAVLYNPRELQIPIPQDVAVNIQRELFLDEQGTSDRTNSSSSGNPAGLASSCPSMTNNTRTSSSTSSSSATVSTDGKTRINGLSVSGNPTSAAAAERGDDPINSLQLQAQRETTTRVREGGYDLQDGREIGVEDAADKDDLSLTSTPIQPRELVIPDPTKSLPAASSLIAARAGAIMKTDNKKQEIMPRSTSRGTKTSTAPDPTTNRGENCSSEKNAHAVSSSGAAASHHVPLQLPPDLLSVSDKHTGERAEGITTEASSSSSTCSASTTDDHLHGENVQRENSMSTRTHLVPFFSRTLHTEPILAMACSSDLLSYNLPEIRRSASNAEEVDERTSRTGEQDTKTNGENHTQTQTNDSVYIVVGGKNGLLLMTKIEKIFSNDIHVPQSGDFEKDFTKFVGHERTITKVQFVAASSMTNVARATNSSSCQKQQLLDKEQLRLISVATDRQIRIWSCATGECLQIHLDWGMMLGTAIILPNSSFLMYASSNQKLQVVDISKGSRSGGSCTSSTERGAGAQVTTTTTASAASGSCENKPNTAAEMKKNESTFPLVQVLPCDYETWCLCHDHQAAVVAGTKNGCLRVLEIGNGEEDGGRDWEEENARSTSSPHPSNDPSTTAALTVKNSFRFPMCGSNRGAPVTWMTFIRTGFVVSLANGVVNVVDCIYSGGGSSSPCSSTSGSGTAVKIPLPPGSRSRKRLERMQIRTSVKTEQPTRPVPLKNCFVPRYTSKTEQKFLGHSGVVGAKSESNISNTDEEGEKAPPEAQQEEKTVLAIATTTESSSGTAHLPPDVESSATTSSSASSCGNAVDLHGEKIKQATSTTSGEPEARPEVVETNVGAVVQEGKGKNPEAVEQVAAVVSERTSSPGALAAEEHLFRGENTAEEEEVVLLEDAPSCKTADDRRRVGTSASGSGTSSCSSSNYSNRDMISRTPRPFVTSETTLNKEMSSAPPPAPGSSAATTIATSKIGTASSKQGREQLPQPTSATTGAPVVEVVHEQSSSSSSGALPGEGDLHTKTGSSSVDCLQPATSKQVVTGYAISGSCAKDIYIIPVFDQEDMISHNAGAPLLMESHNVKTPQHDEEQHLHHGATMGSTSINYTRNKTTEPERAKFGFTCAQQRTVSVVAAGFDRFLATGDFDGKVVLWKRAEVVER